MSKELNMNIYRCQEKAQELGFNNVKFFAEFPVGRIECQWLDAYMGLLKVDLDGLRDGFLMTRQIDEMFPELECTDLRAD